MRRRRRAQKDRENAINAMITPSIIKNDSKFIGMSKYKKKGKTDK